MDNPCCRQPFKIFVAPMDTMDEIVITALKELGYKIDDYNENQQKVVASTDRSSKRLVHTYSCNYKVEIQWREDPSPPDIFNSLSLQQPKVELQPLLVQMLHKHEPLHAETEQCPQQLVRIWNALQSNADTTVQTLATKKPPTDYGDAHYDTLERLIQDGYIQEHDPKHEDPSVRLRIGHYKGLTVSVPQEFTEAHTLVQGPPGSGKSRTILIPNLIERPNTSAIVTEVTAGDELVPTVYARTAGYRAENGHKDHVYYLNPADLGSTRFNPIDFINDISDAIYYADLIITNTTFKFHSGDQIWTQSEKHLLTALLLHAMGLRGDKKSIEGGQSNLGHLRLLLRHGPSDLEKILQQKAIPEARAQFSEFVKNSSPNFRLGVFSGLIQRLNPWLNPRIVKLTEVTDFTQEDLTNNLYTFYLAYPIHRQEYRPMMSLALNFLLNLSLSKQPAKPLTLLLDEFAAYGYIPGIDDKQATIRNNRIGMVFGFQDLKQLEKVYSPAEAEVIFANTNTKIIFATANPNFQRRISGMMGPTTKTRKSVSSTGNITRQVFGRPLMEPAEIGRIPKGQALVVRDSRSPLIVNTCPPGTYEHYKDDYPVPSKPQRTIEKTLYKSCEEAEHLTFNEKEAENQAKTYKQLYDERIATEAAFDQAKKNPDTTQGQLKSLEKAKQAALAAYLTFIETNPEQVPPQQEPPVVPPGNDIQAILLKEKQDAVKALAAAEADDNATQGQIKKLRERLSKADLALKAYATPAADTPVQKTAPVVKTATENDLDRERTPNNPQTAPDGEVDSWASSYTDKSEKYVSPWESTYKLDGDEQ